MCSDVWAGGGGDQTAHTCTLGAGGCLTSMQEMCADNRHYMMCKTNIGSSTYIQSVCYINRYISLLSCVRHYSLMQSAKYRRCLFIILHSPDHEYPP